MFVVLVALGLCSVFALLDWACFDYSFFCFELWAFGHHFGEADAPPMLPAVCGSVPVSHRIWVCLRVLGRGSLWDSVCFCGSVGLGPCDCFRFV